MGHWVGGQKGHMGSFRKDAFTAHLPLSTAAPALDEEMGKKGTTSPKQFLPQLAKGTGPTDRLVSEPRM